MKILQWRPGKIDYSVIFGYIRLMTIQFSPQARRDFDRLGFPVQAKILSALKRLEKWPNVSGCKPMKHEWTGHHRLRVGDWRLIFLTPKSGSAVLMVVKIGHRSEVYEE